MFRSLQHLEITYTTVLGGLLAASSIFSAVHHAFNFGLADLMADFVAFYRNLGQLVFGWIELPFGIRVPAWLHDLWLLSAVGVGIESRATHRGFVMRVGGRKEYRRIREEGGLPALNPVQMTRQVAVKLAQVLGLYGIYRFGYFIRASSMRITDEERANITSLRYLPDQVYKIEMIFIGLALVGFFLFNAYSPNLLTS